MKKLLIAAALIALASPTLAQDAVKPTRIAPDALAWKDAPQLPKGAQYVILIGDPTKAGEMFVQRVKLPANYQVSLPETTSDSIGGAGRRGRALK